MNRDEALELTRSLLLPTSALGYLVTRGPAWPPVEECREYKRAVGYVMGEAYCLLKPIWEEHPDLDPGSESNADPLGDQGPVPAETSPAGLLPYLEEAHRALKHVLPRMLADASLAKQKDFIEHSARQLKTQLFGRRRYSGPENILCENCTRSVRYSSSGSTGLLLRLVPRNTFMIFSRPGGGSVTFSRTGVSFETAPDHYATNGFDHIEPYVARLLVPTNRFKFLHIFTPDGNRGFGFNAKDGVVEAGLTVEWRQETQREASIRAFFSSLGIAPSRDYLAGNGGVPDATRILNYPISGSTAEVTALTKRVLQELCGVSPIEALDITFSEK